MVETEDSKFPKEDDMAINYYLEKDFPYFRHFDSQMSSTITWRRVTEISNDPCLLENHDSFIDGYVTCGSESAKWFPVLFTMLRSKDLINQVVKDVKMQDNFNKTTYNGSFIFSFYGHNHWIDVKIDDRLPFVVGNQKNMFTMSSNKEEFLPALLEKAYARYLGGYGRFQNTNFIEALMHFTGGVIEEVPLRRGLDPMSIEEQRNFFLKVKSLSSDTFLLFQTTPNHTSLEADSVTVDNCLPVDHYYVMTATTSISMKSRSNVVMNVLASLVDQNNSQVVDLIRLLNPLISGDWNGSYNVGSQEWESMSENVRKHYDLKFEHEFEFWIAMNDLIKNMSSSLFCHIPNDRIMDSILKSRDIWYASYKQGGYGISYPEGSLSDIGNNFLKNDQYLVDVPLMKDTTLKAVLHVESISDDIVFKSGCGIIIFKVENNRCYRLHDVKNVKPVAFNPISSTSCSFSLSLVLVRGRYVIIPWRNENLDIVYYLRIYSTSKSVSVNSLKEDKPIFTQCFTCSLLKTMSRAKERILTGIMTDNGVPPGDRSTKKCLSCIAVNPSEATKVTVIGAQGLERNPDKCCNKSYFILRCKNYIYKSTVKSLTNCPIWNEDFLFYRVEPAKEVISIEVFSEESFGFDKSLGIHIFSQYEIHEKDVEELTVPLHILCKNVLVPTSSKILVKFKTYLPDSFQTI